MYCTKQLMEANYGKRFVKQVKDIKNIAKIIWAKPYRYWLLPAWIFMLWLFTYLVNLNLFIYIFSTPTFTFAEKIAFVFQSFSNSFANLDDPRSLSLAIFSLLATVNILLMVRLFRERRSKKGLTKTGSATAVTLIGSHCVTCGGSLLAPFITALAGSGSVFSSARITTGIVVSTLINIVGIILITRSTIQLVRRSQAFVPQQGTI